MGDPTIPPKHPLVVAKQIVSARIVYDLDFCFLTNCNGITLAHRHTQMSSVQVGDLIQLKYEFKLEDHPAHDIFKLGRLR